jgi:superfamily I DNA/RNA helicase
MRVAANEWRPAGVDDLEPAAWTALRSTTSTSVIAGPGAGKTEFLAQRATYLLQTGGCPAPKQILAISFKKDAATNLEARVRLRCSPEDAARFKSRTFDAFTKAFLDRFVKTVPSRWRPTRPYQIVFPRRMDYIEFLRGVQFDAPREWKAEIVAISPEDFETQHVGRWRLPDEPSAPTNAVDFAAQSWWKTQYMDRGKATLTFTMINRLAELILRSNTQILRALRLTHPFVFVDEFQDTTYAQYDLMLSAFQGSKIVVTAVGDEKQRIMRWAGARADAFERIATDFGAATVSLQMNYRSSRELVRIQQVVARALDSGSVEAKSGRASTISDGAAQLWRFRTGDDEAKHLAGWIRADAEARRLRPRDYAVLVKQKAEQYEAQVATAFQRVGMRIRNEARRIAKTTLQDLLAEDLTGVASAVLRLAVQNRAPSAWTLATDSLCRLREVSQSEPHHARRVSGEHARPVNEKGKSGARSIGCGDVSEPPSIFAA